MRCSGIRRSFILSGIVLTLIAAAQGRDDLQVQANALLATTQKTSIFTPGAEPHPFHESVAFTLRGMATGDVKGTFVADYSSKERWRRKYELPQYLEIEVRDGPRIGERSSSDFEPVRVRQLRDALPPKVLRLNSSDVVKKIYTAKLHGVEVRCIDFKNIRGENRAAGQLCVDPVRGTLMRWQHGEIDRQWFDFVPFRGRLYPRHLEVRERNQEIVTAEVEFREAPDLTPAMFHIPDGMPVRKACEHIIPPVRVSGEDPKYPAGLLARSTGTVVVQVKVGADGHVARDAVLQTVSPELDKAAEDAVRRWVFEPARCDGEPMEQRIDVPVEFRK